MKNPMKKALGWDYLPGFQPKIIFYYRKGKERVFLRFREITWIEVIEPTHSTPGRKIRRLLDDMEITSRRVKGLA